MKIVQRKFHKHIFTSFYCIFLSQLFLQACNMFFRDVNFCALYFDLYNCEMEVLFKSKCEKFLTKQLTKWKCSDKILLMIQVDVMARQMCW
jgi:hypothetical protein